MTLLDDRAALQARDPRGLGRLIRGFARQLEDAVTRAGEVRLPGPAPRAAVLVGMGGSAVAGDLLASLWQCRAPFPLQVVRGYTLPRWVGPETLVIVSSYSGSTEETLAAFAAARGSGARLLVVTSGGALGAEADRLGLPRVRIPGGIPPRAALAYLLVPVLVVAGHVAPAVDPAGERDEAIRVLEGLGAELAPEAAVVGNAAKALAVELVDRTPVVYGTDLTAAVAYRWRTQFEENAKVLALSGAVPEMNHNAVEAWGATGAGPWAVVFLRDGAEHPRVARRISLTREVTERSAPSHEVWARGEGRLARLLSLVLVGDWVSYYLALLRGVDPWEVKTLDTFKRRMADPAP